MALLSPLFLQAVPGDTAISYTAQDYRSLISALAPVAGTILAGDLAVARRASGVNMSVDVAAGRAVVAGTSVANQGTYIVQSTAVVNVPIATANATNPRIDIIVAQVYDKQADGGTQYAWAPVRVGGTPAASPVAPSVPPNALLLAEVMVPAAAASIVASNITDKRVLSGLGSIPAWEYSGTSATPQSIPNAAQTSYNPATTTEEVGVVAVGNGSVKIQTPGRYAVSFSARYASGGSSGERTIIIALRDAGGTVRRQMAQRIDTLNQAPMSVSGTLRLQAGETVNAYLFQASGGALSLLNTFSEAAFTGAWLGP